ncbi:MAG: fatty acid desaturase CarF family protein [Methylococcales bacterium]|nr:fatty acid desaturase CarF family protein [Methylococcales bacterium]
MYDGIDIKVREFSSAIEQYYAFPEYVAFETFLAIMVVALQLLSVFQVVQSYHFYSGFLLIISMIIAYLATDFFNGLVHMIVDNNTSYTSLAGPFIAAFHMHHFKLKYTEKHPLHIYFTESGHKFWLVVYLVFLNCLQKYVALDPNLNLGLVSFGILSSFAEVSHYWCHNVQKNNPIILFLQKHRILLSLKHHRFHHIRDNVNYAFLNGVSDPLLNIIARKYYTGYKSRSDKHVATYIKNCSKS